MIARARSDYECLALTYWQFAQTESEFSRKSVA